MSTQTEGATINEPRINERIRVPEVRLVGPAGEQVGIVRIEDALRLAQESDLDLVEVAPDARPPVAKLMDYGKFKYEAAVKAREARRNQANTEIATSQSSIVNLKNQINDLQSQNGSLQEVINRHQSQIQQNNYNIQNEQNAVNNLNRQRATLQQNRDRAQADLDQVDPKAMYEKRELGDFDAILDAFSPDPSPTGAKQNWATSGIGPTGQNALLYSNHTVDALLDSAGASAARHPRSCSAPAPSAQPERKAP